MQGLYSNGNNLSGEHSIIVKTPTKSIIVNPEKSSSCAYTSAMKALQGRIKDLERQLQSKSVIHGKFWEEKLVKFKATYEAINKDLKDKLSKSKCENDFLKKQIEQLNYEKEKHIEKNAVERNQWREEKEKFKDELCMKNENIKKLINDKDVLNKELSNIRDSLNNANKLVDQSTEETKIKIDKIKRKYKDLLEEAKVQYEDKIELLKEQLQNDYKKIDKYKRKSSSRNRNSSVSYKGGYKNELKSEKKLYHKNNTSRPSNTTSGMSKRIISNKANNLKFRKESESKSKPISQDNSYISMRKNNNMSSKCNMGIENVKHKKRRNPVLSLNAGSSIRPMSMSQITSEKPVSEIKCDTKNIEDEILTLEKNGSQLHKESMGNLTDIGKIYDKKTGTMFELKKEQSGII